MGRPKGSKNKPKVGATVAAVVPIVTPKATEDDTEPVTGQSCCGWCYTKQHDDCHSSVDSQPKWKCDCYLRGHKDIAAVGKPLRTKRK